MSFLYNVQVEFMSLFCDFDIKQFFAPRTLTLHRHTVNVHRNSQDYKFPECPYYDLLACWWIVSTCANSLQVLGKVFLRLWYLFLTGLLESTSATHNMAGKGVWQGRLLLSDICSGSALRLLCVVRWSTTSVVTIKTHAFSKPILY
jgi:hypothetical protein